MWCPYSQRHSKHIICPGKWRAWWGTTTMTKSYSGIKKVNKQRKGNLCRGEEQGSPIWGWWSTLISNHWSQTRPFFGCRHGCLDWLLLKDTLHLLVFAYLKYNKLLCPIRITCSPMGLRIYNLKWFSLTALCKAYPHKHVKVVLGKKIYLVFFSSIQCTLSNKSNALFLSTFNSRFKHLLELLIF